MSIGNETKRSGSKRDWRQYLLVQTVKESSGLFRELRGERFEGRVGVAVETGVWSRGIEPLRVLQPRARSSHSHLSLSLSLSLSQSINQIDQTLILLFVSAIFVDSGIEYEKCFFFFFFFNYGTWVGVMFLFMLFFVLVSRSCLRLSVFLSLRL